MNIDLEIAKKCNMQEINSIANKLNISNSRLKNMESALPSGNFMRVHRSYIVNLDRVSSYSRGKIYMDNGDDVPLSVNYRELFRKYLEKTRPTSGNLSQ